MNELFADIDLGALPRYAVALTLGLLMGLERERNPSAKAGLRTFALTALFGVLAGHLATLSGLPWFIAAGLAGVAAMIVGAYVRDPAAGGDPGTTTEAALFLAYGLGVLTWYGEVQLAASIAIAATMLLYFKAELRGISQKLTRQDLISALQFAVVSLIVLPLLPNRDFGPDGALNPYQIWWMVVLISGLSLASYATLRLVGQRHGAVVMGGLGGLVSSTATTLAFARHARENAAMEPVSIVVIVLANLVVMVRLAVVSAVAAPASLPYLLPVLGGGLAAGVAASLYGLGRMRPSGEMPDLTLSNPAEIRSALFFGGLYSLVLLASAWLARLLGEQGLYVVALASGLTDVDAITLSSLRLFGIGQVSGPTLATVVMLAVLANLAFKSMVVAVINGWRVARHTGAGMGAVGAGMILAWWMM
ncbi:MAG: MgtC/SapB family protein [Betaproteobacteria bacterium]|nr:MgtC/SapB family protein [Betaproteobacteria bacterium]